MNKIEDLARRRELLVMKAETQRRNVAAVFYQWRKPLGVFTQGLGIISYIKSRPLLSIGLTSIFLLIGPKVKLVTWGRKLWVGWQVYQSWRASKRQT